METVAEFHGLTHLDPSGAARMVDVSAKPITRRMARASATVLMRTQTLDLIVGGDAAKGDVLERSNLQRQILHTDARVGVPKVISARLALEALNPGVKVVGHEERLTSSNIERIFAGYEVVIDGTDNFPARYLINDACVKLGLPNVHGAVFRFEGEVGVFWPGRPGRPGPCYRCLFPAPPPPGAAPSCAEAGVLGVLPGVIGLLQATETVKLLVGLGEPLTGRMLHFDALQASFRQLRLERDPACPCCGDGRAFAGYVDYERFCAGPHAGGGTPLEA